MRKRIFVITSLLLLILLTSCGMRIGQRSLTLLTPKNGNSVSTLTPCLTWEYRSPFTKEDVTYYLYLSKNNPPILYKANLLKNYYKMDFPLEPNSKYFWTVRAKVGNMIVESPTFSFSTVEDVPPTTPILLSPKQNDVVSIYVTFKWKDSYDEDGDSVSYDLLLSTDSGFSSFTTLHDLNATSIELTLDSSTIYYWKIHARDEKGMITESDIYSFITKDLPPTTPIAIFPKNGQEDVATPVELSWFSVDPEGSILFYSVYFGESTSTLHLSTSNIINSYYIINDTLAENKKYYWKVVATDSSSNVSESAIFMFKTR